MRTITITLTDELMATLHEIATRLGVKPEDLARIGLEGLLNRPSGAFQETVDYVLNKNAELYRRLA